VLTVQDEGRLLVMMSAIVSLLSELAEMGTRAHRCGTPSGEAGSTGLEVTVSKSFTSSCEFPFRRKVNRCYHDVTVCDLAAGCELL